MQPPAQCLSVSNMPTQHGSLQRDDNDYPVMGGTSSVDNKTVVNSAFDPITRRLLVDLIGGGGSNGYQQPTGTVNGSNQVFTWSTAPNVIVVDQGRSMQKVSSDGTVNWTGTTTTTLAIAPNYDVFATN